MARLHLRHFIDLVEGRNDQPWAAQPSSMFAESLNATRRIFSDIDEKLKRFIAVKLPNPLAREARYGKHDGPMTGPLAGFYHCHLRDDAILIYRLTGRTILLVCVVSHAETEGKRGKKLRNQLQPFLKEGDEFENTTPPAILYHASAVSNRESIRRHGLQRQFSDTAELAKGMGEDNWKDYGGIFFSSVPKSHHCDVWQVDVQGLNLERDDTTEHEHLGEEWWVTYTDAVIDPSRLTLILPGKIA